MTAPALGSDRSGILPSAAGPGLGLAPLREAMLAGARAEAAALVAAAEQDRAGTLAEAQREVDELLAQARDQGRREGEALVAAELAEARAADRARLLAAQRRVYDSLRSRAGDRVRELLREHETRRRLADSLARRLGGDATVEATSDGGVLVRTPDGRSIDASVSALLDSALAGSDLSPLWTP